MNMNQVDDDDDDKEDIELEMVRRESMRQFDEEEFRRRAGGRYEGGGSSRQPQGFGRSATVCERGREATRHTSTPAERLVIAEIELEKSRAQSKKSKLNTKWLKIQKENLLKAFRNFIVHNRLPFNIAESPWTWSLLKTAAEVGTNISPPSVYEILEIFLKNEYNEMKKFIFIIMCDNWSGLTRMSIINFVAYSNHAVHYFKIMKEVVEEISPEKVIQVVTDNEAVLKAGGKKLMENFPNLKSFKKVIEQAKVVTQFIYNHNWVVNYMKKFINNRDIVRLGITQFVTNFIALESIIRCRTRLRNKFESEQ
ncbi:hypothetical protein P3X46_001912 [Hevea brasiliensis]|uniref:DUF659 domain-containing protein n=1 Tax=Hevea brasiliensis TaxID=3981 RepID=A0ABQ9N2F5_HEVBR|nr:hypothetical protein P3X46_001912 [Hevea brasiliensis]